MSDIDEMAAEIVRLHKEREWRDISTAPKDGTRILVHLNSKSTIIIRSDDLASPFAMYLDPPSHPTHWQPLPIPPPPREGKHMSEKDNGGPAFPQTIYTINNGIGATQAGVDYIGGMSLRDYFAAAALTGIMARMHESIQHVGSDTFPSNISIHAYRIADALLKARTQGES